MSFRIELFVSELGASARFYERALGFQVERREPDYVGCEVEDLDAAVRRVEATGHTLAEGLQPGPWGLCDFRIVDPDGYYVRVTSG